MSTKSQPPFTDILTLISISIVAYALEIIVHEIIGHGGICLVVGGQPLAVTSTDLFCKLANAPEWKYKFMVSGGGLANFLAVVFCLFSLHIKRYQPHSAYFLWVLLNLNMFLASSYLIASPLLGFGDWDSFVSDLPMSTIWRFALILSGIGCSIYGMKASINALEFQFGKLGDGWVKLLSRVPPFTVGMVGLLLAFVSPLDWKRSLALAAGSLIALLWMLNLHAWSQSPSNNEVTSDILLDRNPFWLVGGAAAFIFLVTILAPGIGSFKGYN